MWCVLPRTKSADKRKRKQKVIRQALPGGQVQIPLLFFVPRCGGQLHQANAMAGKQLNGGVARFNKTRGGFGQIPRVLSLEN